MSYTEESRNSALWQIARSLERIAYALDRISPPAQSEKDNIEPCEEEA